MWQASLLNRDWARVKFPSRARFYSRLYILGRSACTTVDLFESHHEVLIEYHSALSVSRKETPIFFQFRRFWSIRHGLRQAR